MLLKKFLHLKEKKKKKQKKSYLIRYWTSAIRKICIPSPPTPNNNNLKKKVFVHLVSNVQYNKYI